MRGIVEENGSVPFQNRPLLNQIARQKSCFSVFFIWETQENHTWFHGVGYFSAVFVFRCFVVEFFRIASLLDRNRRWWKPYKRVCRQLVRMVVIWQQPKQVLGGNKYTEYNWERFELLGRNSGNKTCFFCCCFFKGAKSFQSDLLKPFFGGFKRTFQYFPPGKFW